MQVTGDLRVTLVVIGEDWGKEGDVEPNALRHAHGKDAAGGSIGEGILGDFGIFLAQAITHPAVLGAVNSNETEPRTYGIPSGRGQYEVRVLLAMVCG